MVISYLVISYLTNLTVKINIIINSGFNLLKEKIDDIWWSVSHKTVYIRWDKYLYIESIIHWWHLWGAWWTITIENKDWTEYFNENDEVFSVFEEWEIKNWELAVQTIFKRKDSSKLFVNSDLTRVTMVSLDWKINKVIWKWN